MQSEEEKKAWEELAKALVEGMAFDQMVGESFLRAEREKEREKKEKHEKENREGG